MDVFFPFFTVRLRLRLFVIVRVDSPARPSSDESPVKLIPIAGYPPNHIPEYEPTEPRCWVGRGVIGRRVVDRRERDTHIYTRTYTNPHILLGKPDADGKGTFRARPAPTSL